MTQQSFTLAQVINICVKVAPSATITDVLNAINAETARDNVPQSETVETPPTAPVETDKTPSPANKETAQEPVNNKTAPKKPTDEQLADAYKKLQAYKEYKGKTQMTLTKEKKTYILARVEDVSDHKWRSMTLAMRKEFAPCGWVLNKETGNIEIPCSTYNRAKRLCKVAK